MSRTDAGRRLTWGHKQHVSLLAHLAARAVAPAIGDELLRTGGDTSAATLVAQVRSVIYEQAASAAAVDYVTRIADAERMTLSARRTQRPRAEVHAILRSRIDDAYRLALRRGLDESRAAAYAAARMSPSIQRLIADSSRSTVLDACRRGGVRWRRVTDGRPCAFCAMLAARGPVYVSEDTSSFDAHGGCGCTAEPCAYTPDEWIERYATPTEVSWVNAYYEAAGQATARGEPRVAPKPGARRDTILTRMRINQPSLFSNGYRRKNPDL